MSYVGEQNRGYCRNGFTLFRRKSGQFQKLRYMPKEISMNRDRIKDRSTLDTSTIKLVWGKNKRNNRNGIKMFRRNSEWRKTRWISNRMEQEMSTKEASDERHEVELKHVRFTWFFISWAIFYQDRTMLIKTHITHSAPTMTTEVTKINAIRNT